MNTYTEYTPQNLEYPFAFEYTNYTMVIIKSKT